MTSEALCLHLLPCLFDGQGFAPDGRVTSLCLRIAARCKEKVTKETHPHPAPAAPGPDVGVLFLAYFFLGKQEEVRRRRAQPRVRPALQSRLWLGGSSHETRPSRLPFDGRSLIEASAGTGKTWTLTALYARLLLERQLSVGQILVVTYTTAATAELRERIRARLADLLAVYEGTPSSDDFLNRLHARYPDDASRRLCCWRCTASTRRRSSPSTASASAPCRMPPSRPAAISTAS